MRKILLLAVCMLCCANAFAQIEFYGGPKGGIAGNWIPNTVIDPDDEVLPNFGFYAGAFAAFDLNEFNSIQAELLYSRKGITTVGQIFDNRYVRSIHYIQLPVYYSMRLFDDQYRVMVGPEFGYALGSRIKSDAGVIDPASATELNRFNLALGIQGSYFVTDELGVDVKIEQALTKTFSDAGDEGYNASISFGLCYRFGY